MPRPRREAFIPLFLGVAAFALAFAQRPGLATTDTKINLHVAPGRFLADVASMWTSTGQLGEVQAGQHAGYLFPMGPFFALGHATGMADWVVQRLWLGTLLALAAGGVVRLLDALLGGRRGVAQLVAGLVVLLNPFVVTYANRTTVTLLAYAALPWLLLAVHKGVRDRGGWRWPAAFALLVTASGGGINAAVTGWMLLGPALLLLYELAFAGAAWHQARGFLLRMAPLTLLASLWWILPTLIQSSYGINFLNFTEQPGTVWGTTGATESLRLMGFWLSYVGLGFAGQAIPYFDDARTLLFSAPVVVGTLLVPAVALGGFVWTRRWLYGPFFLGLALVAVLVMMAGFPEGTPLRHGLNFAYDHLASARFLRTTYKAAPLLVVALACLAGAAAAEAWRRLATAPRRRLWSGGAALAGATVLTLAAWPLVSGRAQDAQVSWKRIPAAWRTAASDLDRDLPRNSRAIVLPGSLFSFYRWGGTVDPLLPALSRRPVAVRTEVPYADLRATDLLWTIDGLVHQRRLLPGQLGPLLSLIGARAVVVGADDDLARSDAPPPADAAAELSSQPGFARAARTYGPRRRAAPSDLGRAVSLPQVRRYDLTAGRGLARVEPSAPAVVVDGSADAIAELAAFGALPNDRPLLYAADLSTSQLRRTVTSGGEVVISDANRRRAFVAARLEQDTGPTLTGGETVSNDGIMFDPFGRGPDFETLAAYSGARSVEAPSSPGRPQFPEHRPFAGVDGSAQTAWLADPTLDPSRRWLQVNLDHPLDVPYVDLLPYGDAGGIVRRVQIGGRVFSVHAGWNRLPLRLRGVSSMRVSLAHVTPHVPGAAAGAGGISELRIPGVRVGEELRVPQHAAGALAGHDLGIVGLTYLFQRTTGDDPYRRNLVHGPWSARRVQDAVDAEQTMRRAFGVPAPRTFTADAWVTVAAAFGDDAVDRLAGYRGPLRATSSGRFDGRPQWRASRALDGDPRTAWIGDTAPGQRAWLAWRSSAPMAVGPTLRLIPPREPVRRPTRVRLSWPAGATSPLAVDGRGRIVLGHTIRARAVRIDILSTAPGGASSPAPRAVGIADVRGIAGLPPPSRPGARTFTAPCGSVRVRLGGQVLALRAAGSADAFESGTPLHAQLCGKPVGLTAGVTHLAVQPGVFAIDDLRLSSAAPHHVAPVVVGGGRVLDPGSARRGTYDDIRVAVTGPSWLVLGEGYNRGWRAWCDGRSLGAPAAVDGYANGWRVGPSCHRVRFAFAPNRVAELGYAVSILAGLTCLALLIGAAVRRRRRRADAPAAIRRARAAPAEIPDGRAVAAWPLRRAVLAALLAGAVFGFVFGLNAGVLAVPAIALVLWRGIGAGALALGAAGLLGVVVPVLYLAHPGHKGGGNHFGYAMQHMAAHWVGIAALGLLIAALWRTLSLARR